MSRPIVVHGRELHIRPMSGLPPGRCGVALVGETGDPVWTVQGPCESFDTDAAIQLLDTVRARLLLEMERLDDALGQQHPGERSLRELKRDQPYLGLRWLPPVTAVGLVMAALATGQAATFASAVGLLLGVALVLHVILALQRESPPQDPDVSAMGWAAMGWGVLTLILWLSLGSYYEDHGPPSGSPASLVAPLMLVAAGGMMAGYWLRDVWLTRRAAAPDAIILSPFEMADLPPGAALYGVSWNGRMHPCLGVPAAPYGLALMPVEVAWRQLDEVGSFAQRVLAQRAAHELAHERRGELASRVAAVEDALRELDAGR